eukprot:CAMPEP_0113500734 /NCGR_PEP_ID=MMETSP0014_2-20120614/32511_1 /TAXON_ID=2857 /ORGANISM="Nitzschia sp." /LENGTH=211 /DNA_ID=CAMNT_0000395139 /DNA_START=606 /DNA_END=1241 /DNA_ORIENTATION=+ /assembly_acc=CAM_ASM_000159
MISRSGTTSTISTSTTSTSTTTPATTTRTTTRTRTISTTAASGASLLLLLQHFVLQVDASNLALAQGADGNFYGNGKGDGNGDGDGGEDGWKSSSTAVVFTTCLFLGIGLTAMIMQCYYYWRGKEGRNEWSLDGNSNDDKTVVDVDVDIVDMDIDALGNANDGGDTTITNQDQDQVVHSEIQQTQESKKGNDDDLKDLEAGGTDTINDKDK